MPSWGLAVRLDVGVRADLSEWSGVAHVDSTGVLAVWRTGEWQPFICEVLNAFYADRVFFFRHCDRKTHSRNITTIGPKGREKSLLFWQDVCFVKCCIVIQQVHRTVSINCRHPPENRHSCWRCLQQGTICACWDKTEGMSIPPVGKYSSDQSISCSVSRLFHHLLALSCSLWRVWTLVCWLREILPHPWKEHICLCLTR